MKIYNTLSRQLENFQPLTDKVVNIYSCGPTVYDHIHIGNLSSFIYADTLHRTLAASGYKVNHVMNFTDVDDKTIARSSEQYPGEDPNQALKSLTKHYSEIFLNDLAAVGVDTKTIKFVNATDSIPEMQTLIGELYKHKFAYVTEDGVYFSIQAYKDSGKKYGQLTEVSTDSTSQARIRNDEYDKGSAHDFALWKSRVNNEPAWDFELEGHKLPGRPGWHIECSAMSSANLGQPFDIHTGGVDLIFPHHENEIAQSTAGKDDKLYAKYFVHNEHLLVDGRKMSKSLNNFFTLRDIVEKGYDPLAFRLMILQSHYRNQSNFTWENLEAAQNRLNDLRAWADLRHQPSADTMPYDLDDLFKETRQSVHAAMSDDMDTPQALAALSKLVNYMQTIPIPGTEGAHTNGTLKMLDDLLGLNISDRPDISNEQKALIKQRQQARDDKEWHKSDEIRDQLQQQGIGVRDTEHGPIWFRL